jgi:crotonobetainyl-CoA:carnitine CoA-transferase CaiB-like acyl-CoA transferase
LLAPLLDLGARVIKVERPDGGDLSRRLYLSDTEIGGDSTIFHAINRGKESFAVDMKDEATSPPCVGFSRGRMW